MNEQHISRLEEQLERLVEGTFAHLFGRRITARDIAVQLARSMEDGLKKAEGPDSRRIAPDRYAIYLHPDIHKQLQRNQPELPNLLSQHITELAAQAGYRLLNTPIINNVANTEVNTSQVIVHASHITGVESSTGLFHQVKAPSPPATKPKNAQLIINGTRNIHLEQTIVNIGRSSENQVIIEDPYISRQHVQIRLRFGSYVLFDAQSKGGTFVNNVPVREHRLQSGDVIRLGGVQIVYMDDDSTQPGTTQAMSPVDS